MHLISWSRITLRSLELSIYYKLPMYRRYRIFIFPYSSVDSCARLCHPERYGIRRVIQASLILRTTELNELVSHEASTTSDQESRFSHVLQELGTLVRLFDQVLLEEYRKDHGSLDTVDIQQDHMTCSFCGSCPLLSSFFCNGCSEDTFRPALICVGCYVEGRSCECNAMNAVCLGDFQSALRDWNNAVNSLSRSSYHQLSMEGLAEVSER